MKSHWYFRSYTLESFAYSQFSVLDHCPSDILVGLVIDTRLCTRRKLGSSCWRSHRLPAVNTSLSHIVLKFLRHTYHRKTDIAEASKHFLLKLAPTALVRYLKRSEEAKESRHGVSGEGSGRMLSTSGYGAQCSFHLVSACSPRRVLTSLVVFCRSRPNQFHYTITSRASSISGNDHVPAIHHPELFTRGCKTSRLPWMFERFFR